MSFSTNFFSLLHIKFNEGHIFFKRWIYFTLSSSQKSSRLHYIIYNWIWHLRLMERSVDELFTSERKVNWEINIKMICNLQLFKRGRIIKCKRKMRTPGNKWLNWFKGCFHSTQILRKGLNQLKSPINVFISKMVKLYILLPFWLLLLNKIFSEAKIISWLKLRKSF